MVADILGWFADVPSAESKKYGSDAWMALGFWLEDEDEEEAGGTPAHRNPTDKSPAHRNPNDRCLVKLVRRGGFLNHVDDVLYQDLAGHFS